MSENTDEIRIAVIGLGYVGLPLAVAFAEKYPVVAFDKKNKRVDQLINGVDETNEVDEDKLKNCQNIKFTSSEMDLSSCNVYIVAVPTPIDSNNNPDLVFCEAAADLVGRNLKIGDTVVVESTVFPGFTEDVFVPRLANKSSLTPNQQFFFGYSPERVNPGDKSRKITDIVKVVAGSTSNTTEFLRQIYSNIIEAGVYCAESIKTAELAKVLENTQRDLNIALMNELAIICSKLNIRTNAVIDAASTKWNFNEFRPGLVGGHCIGVDPYYLTYKAQLVGHAPEIILAGRRLNEQMPSFVASSVVKKLTAEKMAVYGADILILGCTFKENCPDTRNSKVKLLVEELISYGCKISLHDPLAAGKLNLPSTVRVVSELPFNNSFDVLLVAVPHDDFVDIGIDKLKENLKEQSLIFDLKGSFDSEKVDMQL